MHLINELHDWWHKASWVELIGALTGLICVWLAAVNNIWNWPVAIVSVILYIIVFHGEQLYADMGLQFYFLAMNFYGWYFWSQKPAIETKAPVVLITSRQLTSAGIIIAVTTGVLGFTLIKLATIIHYKPASFPYLDSFCAACSLVAQFYMARKVLENWLIWIFVDIIYVGIYIVKGLGPTAVLYAAYVPIAIVGYFDWRREYRSQIQHA